jgi:hypothetical protein
MAPDHMRMRSHSVTEQHVQAQYAQSGLVMYNEASQARQGRVGTDPGVLGHGVSSGGGGLGTGLGLSSLEFGKRRKGKEKAKKARSEGWSVATEVGSGSGRNGEVGSAGAIGGASGGGTGTGTGRKKGGRCAVM